MNPSVQSFEVHHRASQRVVMVLVFPSTSDANLVRGEMALHQESTTPDPYLLSGYGPSVWNGNIAMVESTQCQLQRVAQLQADQDNGIYHAPAVVLDARAPSIAVDVDFEQALSNGTVNL